MFGVQNHQQQKEGIMALIKTKGPSLPVHVARGIGVEPLFAGAFLSELYSEKKIKISNMKVGGSPLYYIEGQEEQLERFIEHLAPKEKEAFLFLKKEKALEDDALEPVARVALRAIKDFAVPVRIRIDNDSKLYWKYFLLPDSDMKSLIQNKLMPLKKEEKTEVQEKLEAPAELKVEQKKEIPEKKEKKELIPVQEKLEKPAKGEKREKPKKTRKEKEKKPEEFEFGKGIKDYLSAKDMEILEVLLDKKKEFIAKIRIDMLFGKQEFLLVGKDKKSVNDNDLTVALQRAQLEKMPVLFVSIGELNKKGVEYLKNWRNLVKFERLKN